jgi:hypothetical protein
MLTTPSYTAKLISRIWGEAATRVYSCSSCLRELVWLVEDLAEQCMACACEGQVVWNSLRLIMQSAIILSGTAHMEIINIRLRFSKTGLDS